MNLLLITLDTTRADALGAYGAPEGSTPALDGLAREAVVFDHAWTTAPLTLPAHASLLTGLYPRSHGVRRNGDFRLPAGTPTIASVLRESGYTTAAFVSSIVLDRSHGLDQGFDRYDDLSSDPTGPRQTERKAPVVASRAIEWLRAGPPHPFFLWVHFYDAHAPYDPPPALRERFADPYAAEVALVDQEIGRLLEALDVEGFGDGTIVVVAGDHGEDRLEHGEPEHGVLLHESVLHVPLLVRAPGRRDLGRHVGLAASLVDVCPTLLELLDLSFPEPLQGRALLLRSAPVRGKDPELYAESTLPQAAYGWSPLEAIVRDRWKLIDGPVPELYDLRSDPSEKNDLAARDPARVKELRGHLVKLRDGMRPPASDTRFDPSPAERAALAALGYVGSHPEPERGAPQGPNPKSMIRVLALLSQGRDALRLGDAASAIGPLETASRLDPSNARVESALGAALHEVGRLGEARTAFESALATNPKSPELLANLGATLEALGDRANAENCYRNALAGDPDLTAARVNLVLLLFQSGRVGEALTNAETVTKSRPDLALPFLIAGRCRETLGDAEGARRDYSRALEIAERVESGEVPESLLIAAEAAFRMGDGERGERISRTLLEKFPSAESLLRERLAEFRPQ